MFSSSARYRSTSPSFVRSRSIAATVAAMRGSSTGRKPTSGRSRRLASSRSEPYDCVNAPTPSWKPSRHTWACTSSRSASHRSTGPVRPCSSTIRIAAVERDPRHHLRVGEVASRAAHLPDPLVGLAPDVLEAVEQAAAERPGVVQRREPAGARLVQRVEDLAVDVELELRARRVADADGPRPLVALEPRELELRDPPLSGEPVQRLRPVGRACDRAEQPVAPRARLVLVSGADQREEGERRVPDPAEAVVPVPDAAEALRQRRGRGRDDPAGRRVRQRLEGDERPDQRVAVRSSVRAAVRPVVPERLGLRERRLGVDVGGLVVVRRVPGEDERDALAGLDVELGDRVHVLADELDR